MIVASSSSATPPAPSLFTRMNVVPQHATTPGSIATPSSEI